LLIQHYSLLQIDVKLTSVECSRAIASRELLAAVCKLKSQVANWNACGLELIENSYSTTTAKTPTKNSAINFCKCHDWFTVSLRSWSKDLNVLPLTMLSSFRCKKKTKNKTKQKAKKKKKTTTTTTTTTTKKKKTKKKQNRKQNLQ